MNDIKEFDKIMCLKKVLEEYNWILLNIKFLVELEDKIECIITKIIIYKSIVCRM